MIRLNPKDLIAIKHDGEYFYYLVRTKIKFFGGNMVFVFHRTSSELLGTEELLAGNVEGFHTFVDFIEAKKKNTMKKMARNVDIQTPVPQLTKMSPSLPGKKAEMWHFHDLDDNLKDSSPTLSKEQAKYPTQESILVENTFEMVKLKTPEGYDERI